MTIAKRLQEVIRYLREDDLEGAILPLFSAVDATAQKDYSEKENRMRIEKWLRNKQGFVTWYLLRGAELTGNISLSNKMKLETALYKWLRCPSIHQAEINQLITLTKNPVLGVTLNGMLFSHRHAEGIALAVVCSSSNKSEKCPENILCPFFQGNSLLNDLWGNEQKARSQLDLTKNFK